MRRRRFLGLTTSAAILSSCDTTARPVFRPAQLGGGVFLHGVASGDPLADRVVLWTRVTVARARPTVRWVVADDPDLSEIVAEGDVETSAERDYTVKVDVDGLEAGRTYFYAFELDEARSAVGRTRTLPDAPVDRVRLGVASCSNYANGFFTAYAVLARTEDLDAVLHLGDYIYEYAHGVYADGTALGRIPEPRHECTSLADYRARHATHKADPDLQEVHRRHPFITIWDDHEIADNTWRDGAKNHQEDEGMWDERKAAAVQAYREWMPIRDPAPGGDPLVIYRHFRFGDLLDLVMLDTRLVGRDRQVRSDDVEGFADPRRSLLGPAQERWLADQLRASVRDGIHWRALGQQVRMGQRLVDGRPSNTDSWDGYPAARDRFFDVVEGNRIADVVVLTGDMHNSWAMELRRDPFARPPTPAIAVELVCPAISSPLSKHAPDLDETRATHPHVRWAEFAHHGFLVVEWTARQARASWHFVEGIDRPDHAEAARKTFTVPRGSARVTET